MKHLAHVFTVFNAKEWDFQTLEHGEAVCEQL